MLRASWYKIRHKLRRGKDFFECLNSMHGCARDGLAWEPPLCILLLHFTSGIINEKFQNDDFTGFERHTSRARLFLMF